MADKDINTGTEQEQFLDSMSSSELSLDALTIGLSSLGRSEQDLAVITAAVSRDTSKMYEALRKYKVALEKFGQGEDIKGLENIRKMNSNEMATLIANMTNIWTEIEKSSTDTMKDFASKFKSEMGTITTRLSSVISVSLEGLLEDIASELAKSSKVVKKAEKKVKVEPSEHFNMKAISEAKNKPGSKIKNYKSGLSEAVSPALKNPAGKSLMDKILTAQKLPVKSLTYPASSSGLYHQRDATVVSHSMDMISAFKDLLNGQGLDSLKGSLVDSKKFKKEDLDGLSLNQMLSKYFKTQGLDLNPKQVSNQLKSDKVQDLTVLSSMVHDLVKYTGNSAMSGKGYNKDHAIDLEGFIKNLDLDLTADEKTYLNKSVTAAGTHHDPNLSKLVNSDMDTQITAALVRLLDGISAKNATPLGINGYPEPDTDGYTQKAISSRENVFKSVARDEESLRNGAMHEADPRGFILDRLMDMAGGELSNKDRSRDILDSMGLKQIADLFEQASEPIKQILAYSRGADGKGAVGLNKARTAVENISGGESGILGNDLASMKPLDLGQILMKTDTPLVVAQTLEPAIFKGLEETLRTKPETKGIADRLAHITKGIDKVIPDGNEILAIKEIFNRSSDLAPTEMTQEKRKPTTPISGPEESTSDRYKVQRATHYPKQSRPEWSIDAVQDFMDELINTLLTRAEANRTSGVRENALASGEIAQLVNTSVMESFNGLSTDDQLTAARTLSTTASATYKSQMSQAGIPELDAVQKAVNVQKAIQQIEESKAKAQVMAARGKETEVKTDTLLKTQGYTVSQETSKADKLSAESIIEMAKAETALSTQADEVMQKKAKTAELMSKMTEEQKEQIKLESANALAKNKVEHKDIDVEPQKLIDYYAAAREVRKAQDNLISTEQQSVTSSQSRSSYYKKNSDIIQSDLKGGLEKLDPTNLAGAQALQTIATQQMTQLKEQQRLKAEVSNKEVAAARSNLEIKQQELELLKKEFTLENDLLTIQAKADQAVNRVHITDSKKVQEEVKARIDTSTEKDIIDQAKLNTVIKQNRSELTQQQALLAKIKTDVAESTKQDKINQEIEKTNNLKNQGLKIEQQIEESKSKALLLDERTNKMSVETATLLATQGSTIDQAKSTADKAYYDSTRAKIEAEKELITQADQIRQIKAKTLQTMDKLTAAQKAQVLGETERGMQYGNLYASDIEVDPNSINSYNQKIEEVRIAIKDLSEIEAKALNSAKARSEEYAKQVGLLDQQLASELLTTDPKDKAGVENANLKHTKGLESLKEQYKIQSDLSSKEVTNAATNLANKQKDLGLTKEQLTLKAELVSIEAKSIQDKSRAQISQFQVTQKQIQSEIDLATKKDVIQQTKLKTLSMEEDLKRQILDRTREQYGLGKAGVQQAKQQLDIIQKINQQSIITNMTQAAGLQNSRNATGYSATGVGAGQGINTGALKYSTRNAVWGVLGGLTGIASATQLLRQSTINMKDYETAIVNLKRVWQEVPNNQVLKALSDMNELALDYGQTIQNVASIQEEWAKVGLETAEDLESSSRTSILALNTSDMTDAEKVVKFLNSARVQMRLTIDDTEALLDSWNKLADATTADTSDFAEAYQKSAGYARQVGLSTQDLDSIIATLAENTGRSGDEIGTSLRQMFSNVYGPRNIKKLQGLGIEVFKDPLGVKDSTAPLKDFDVLLGSITDKYNELKTSSSGGDLSQDMITLLGVLGETRRRNYAIGLLEGYEKSGLNKEDTTGTYSGISQTSKGYSEKKFELTMDTLSYKATLLEASFTQAANAFGETGVLDVMKATMDFLSSLLQGFSNLDPVQRNILTSFMLMTPVLAGLKKLSKAVFGQTLIKSLVIASRNSKTLNKVWSELLEKGPISKEFTKSMLPGQTTNIDGTLLSFKKIEEAMLANDDLRKRLAESATQIGITDPDEIDSYRRKQIDSTLAGMGSVDHSAKMTKETTDLYEKQVKEALDTSEELGDVVDANSDIFDKQTGAIDSNIDVNQRATIQTDKKIVSDVGQVIATEAVGDASVKTAPKVLVETGADISQTKASMDAAIANTNQAAASAAVGKTAAATAAKTALLSAGLSIAVGIVASLAMAYFMSKNAIEQVTDKLIVQVQKQRDEISGLKSLKQQHGELQDQMALSSEGTNEYNRLKQRQLDVEKDLYDLAPSLGEYYNSEYGFLVKNIEVLDEYIKLKEIAATESTQLLLDSSMQTEDKIRSEMASRKAEEEKYSFLQRLYTKASSMDETMVLGKDVPDFLNRSGIDPEEYAKHLGGSGFNTQNLNDKLSKIDITTIQDEYNDLIDQLFGLQFSVAQAEMDQYLAENPDLILQIDYGSIKAKISADRLDIENELDTSDLPEDISANMNTAIDNILSKNTDSTKYKAGTQYILDQGHGDLDVQTPEGTKTIEEIIKSGKAKNYLADMVAIIEKEMDSDTQGQVDRLTNLISLSQKDVTETNSMLETAISEVDGFKEEKTSILGNLEELAMKAYKEEGQTGDKDLFTRDFVSNSLDNNTEKRLKYLDYAIEGNEKFISEQENELGQLIVILQEANTKLLALDPENINIEAPDYASLAQDYADKLIGSDNRLEAKEILTEIKDYFGDATIGDISIGEMTEDELYGDLRNVLYALNQKAIGSSKNIQESMDNLLVNAPQLNGELQAKIKDYSAKYGAEDLDGFIGFFSDGSIQIETLAKQAGEALNVLDDAVTNGTSLLDATNQQAIGILRTLFSDLDINGMTLSNMSSEAIALNADAIAVAINLYLADQSGMAYEYAIGQIEVGSAAIAEIDNILSNTQYIMRKIAAELPVEEQKAARAAANKRVAELQVLRDQIEASQKRLNSYLIEAPKSPPKVEPYRGTGSKSGGGGGDKWAALDKQVAGVTKRIDDLSSSIQLLQTIWANDLTNQKYLNQAYTKQTKLIEEYTSAINELTRLREKTRGDKDKYDQMTDTIEGYTIALYQAYQEESNLFSTSYQRRIEDVTRKFDTLNKKLEAIETTTKIYNATEKSLQNAHTRTNLQLSGVSAQYNTTQKEIERVTQEIKELKAVASSAGNSFKGIYAAGQIDALQANLEDLKLTVIELDMQIGQLKQNLISVFAARLTDAYNASLDVQLDRVNKIRKAEEKSHNRRIERLNELLDRQDNEWKAEDDKRELADLEAEISLVKTRIRRLGADSSQYGQKLLRDAYKDLGALETQYGDKVRSMSQEQYRENIEDQIDSENERYDELTESLDDEEEAYNDHYETLLDNVDSFAEGLYEAYRLNQKSVLDFLKSPELMADYNEAGKMATAAYNAGLSLTSPTLQPDGTIGYKDYNSTPGNTYGNTGDIPSTKHNTGIDYMAQMLGVKSQLDNSKSDAEAIEYYYRLQGLEELRNKKIDAEGLPYAKTYEYLGDFSQYPKSYHTGGVAGISDLPEDIKSMFGIGNKEVLIKALVGEYLIPEAMMDNLIPNLRSSIAESLKSIASNVSIEDIVPMKKPIIPGLKDKGTNNIDQSMTIDKVMNIEHAVFESPLDIETLEDVAGRYLKETLSRKGLPNRR